MSRTALPCECGCRVVMVDVDDDGQAEAATAGGEVMPDILTSKSYWAKIFMAGDYDTARQTCKQFCMRGLCVNVSRTNYIYTGGEETGVVVELINYPKFASTHQEILDTAKVLAEQLIVSLCQFSYTIMTPEETFFYSRGEDVRKKNRTEERMVK